MAESIGYGVRIGDARMRLIRIDEEGTVDEAGCDMLASTDGIIFGCPTQMGGPSWQFKRFADATIRAWEPTLWRDKLAGGFTTSTGIMAANPFDDPERMSPSDLATAAAFEQRFATFLATGKTPHTPYFDFTKN
ncbi:MAG TPA: NAD(P)H-dependent oxidoreductase [Mycobacterium sp.]